MLPVLLQRQENEKIVSPTRKGQKNINEKHRHITNNRGGGRECVDANAKR